MRGVFIVGAARTPIGSFGGALATIPATELGAFVIKEAVTRAHITADLVQEVYMGNVLSANLGQAPTKIAALKAGLSVATPCTTVNKVCASGMKSIMIAAQSIMVGDNDIVVAGGMESMSNAPYYIPQARYGYRYGNAELLDAIVRDALQDPYKKYMMGNVGEICATRYQISREQQDAYAIESYKRAFKAYEEGAFAEELVPVPVVSKKGETLITADEEFAKVDFSKVATLKPVFAEEGTITAANASKINDGAAAVVLMSEEKVRELGVKPIARIMAFADASQDPEWFTTTPSIAMPKAVRKAGLQLSDIDYFEINEAFSVVALANIKEMQLDHARVNVYGGAVSLGHPVGMSGARITITLATVLHRKNGRYGCAGICNGGGGASAIVLERV